MSVANHNTTQVREKKLQNFYVQVVSTTPSSHFPNLEDSLFFSILNFLLSVRWKLIVHFHSKYELFVFWWWKKSVYISADQVVIDFVEKMYDLTLLNNSCKIARRLDFIFLEKKIRVWRQSSWIDPVLGKSKVIFKNLPIKIYQIRN